MKRKNQKKRAQAAVAARMAAVDDHLRDVAAFVMSRDPPPEPTRAGGLIAATAPDRLLWLADAVASRKPPPFEDFVRIVREVANAVTMDPPRAPACQRCGARVDSGAEVAGMLRPLWDPPRPEIARPFFDEPHARWWLHGRLLEAAARLAGYCTDECATADGEQALREDDEASKARA